MFAQVGQRHHRQRSRTYRRIAGAVMLILLGSAAVSGCDPNPPPPPPPTTTLPEHSSTPPPATPPADREALYDYCDRAVGPDPACYTPRFQNNLRAADAALKGPDSFGGIRETTVTAQGLTALAVGTTLDVVMNEFEFLELPEGDVPSASCSVRMDPNVRLGVVARRDSGPRGEVDVVEAFMVDNPVIRTSADIGVGSTLKELQDAHGPVEVVAESGNKYATTTPEGADDGLYSSSPERIMRFTLGPGDVVTSFSVGAPEFVAGC
jgi:hypothetical protein